MFDHPNALCVAIVIGFLVFEFFMAMRPEKDTKPARETQKPAFDTLPTKQDRPKQRAQELEKIAA